MGDGSPFASAPAAVGLLSCEATLKSIVVTAAVPWPSPSQHCHVHSAGCSGRCSAEPASSGRVLASVAVQRVLGQAVTSSHRTSSEHSHLGFVRTQIRMLEQSLHREETGVKGRR